MSIFEGIIGQNRAKNALIFSLECYQKTRFFPPTILTGSRGFGKTSMAKTLKYGLLSSMGAAKPFLIVNGATAKNLTNFISSIVQPYLIDKEAILFIDEIHAASLDVRRWLLSALPTGRETLTTVQNGDEKFDLNYKLINIIAATTNIENLSLPLRERFERIDLEPYTDEQLIQILAQKSPEISYKDNVELEIVKTCRQSPRLIEKRAAKIIDYCYKKKIFGQDDWAKLFNILGLFPLGLTSNEIEHLKHLQRGPLSLTNMAAKLGLDTKTVRTDIETYLHTQDLINIEGKRYLTQKGRNLISKI